MKPTNDREREIARHVDTKAKAIREGLGTWDDQIVTEMRVAVKFEMSDAEFRFLCDYVTWRRQNPL